MGVAAAVCVCVQDKTAEAEKLFFESLEVVRAAHGDRDHVDMATVRHKIAGLYMHMVHRDTLHHDPPALGRARGK